METLGATRVRKVGLERLACLFTLFGLILYLGTIGTPAIMHGTFILDGYSVSYGPFRYCQQLANSDCWTINAKCEVSSNGHSARIVNDCDRWNTARGLLFVGMVFTFVAMIIQFLITCMRIEKYSVRFLAFFFGFSAAVGGLAAMALYLKMKDVEQWTNPSIRKHEYDYGFWMLVAAWPVILVASLPFLKR